MATTRKPKEPETLLGKLAAKFDPTVIRKNPNGYHYVSIDAMYQRLDDVLGANWELEVVGSTLTMLPRSEKTYGRNEKTAFIGTVTVRITATLDGVTTVRSGVGADLADDPDKVIKTALANAVKKAGNGFGIGRYLWSEEERADIDRAVAEQNDVPALKAQVVALAQEQGLELPEGKPEIAKALAAHFKVEPGDLASASTLKSILEANA